MKLMICVDSMSMIMTQNYTSHTKTMLPTRKSVPKIQQAIRPHKDLLTIVKRRKLQWYGHHRVRHGERLKKTRQTEEEVGRQHQGMDRHGVRQVPEGSGKQGKKGENWLQNHLWCPNDPRS